MTQMTFIYETEIDSGIEMRFVVTKGGGGWKGNGLEVWG